MARDNDCIIYSFSLNIISICKRVGIQQICAQLWEERKKGEKVERSKILSTAPVTRMIFTEHCHPHSPFSLPSSCPHSLSPAHGSFSWFGYHSQATKRLSSDSSIPHLPCLAFLATFQPLVGDPQPLAMLAEWPKCTSGLSISFSIQTWLY